ncbi:MAG: sulfite exporter TauE/SafE family protein [Deltaproteobacteria bacterium]|nr:MAG: sulfite exporter TauE/SafE family protein [Deltaproteobacteria bacterium]
MEHLLWCPSWEWWQWLLLVLGGLGCGFINTVAGGGSMLTVPLLIVMGLPAQIANATNRLSLVVQTGTATAGFLYHGIRDTRTIAWLALPGLGGSWFGAQLAVHLPPEVFRKVFAVLLAVAVLPILFRPQFFEDNKQPPPQRPSWTLIVTFFFVGVYSGFIQIGAGIWSLLALLWLGNHNVKYANAVKVQLLFLTTSLATLVFLWHDQVVLVISAILAVGTATGSWLATRLLGGQRKVTWVRWLLLAASLAAILKLLL